MRHGVMRELRVPRPMSHVFRHHEDDKLDETDEGKGNEKTKRVRGRGGAAGYRNKISSKTTQPIHTAYLITDVAYNYSSN